MVQTIKRSLKGLLIMSLAAMLLTACKSDVKKKEGVNAQSVINLDTFKIVDHNDVTQGNIKGAIITDKYYSFSLCMSENTIGQNLDRRPVRIDGVQLKNNGFTNPSGCVFWDQKIKYNYNVASRCQTFNTKVTLTDTNVSKDFNYAIDLLENKASNLEFSKGCTLLAQNEIDPSQAQTKSEKRRLERSTDVLTLSKIVGVSTGQSGLDTPNVRSDVKTILSNTKIKSCIKTQLDDSLLKYTKIKLTVDDQIYDSETDQDGCFEHVIKIAFEQYLYSHWLEKTLHVSIESGPLKGTELSRLFYINPWEPGSRSYVLDELSQDQAIENPNKKYNRISVDGVMYILIGNNKHEFKVNNNLNLTVAKSYQVVLTPRIDRGHRFSQSVFNRYEKMHNGRFRLKFMILAPDHSDMNIDETNFKNFTYLTGAEKEVEVKDGIINEVITIPARMTDLPRLAMRTVTIFKLEPIDDIGLRNTVVTGFFKAKIPWIKTNVLQAKALQDYDETSVKNEYDPSVRQNNIDVFRKNLEKKSFDEISTQVIDRENFNEMDDQFISDVLKKEYKEHVEFLFSNINVYRDKVIYGNPDVYVRKRSDNIYFEHLMYRFQDVMRYYTYDFEDINVGDGETKEDENKEVSLQKGEIDKLYDYSYEYDRELLGNKTYQRITAYLCNKTFKPTTKKNLIGKTKKVAHPDLKSCLEKPYNYFDLNRTMHSLEVTNTLPKFAEPIHLNIGSNFSAGTYQSTYTWESQRIGADVGMKLPLGDLFSAGVRIYEYSKGWAQNTGKSVFNNDSIYEGLQILVEKYTIGLKGTFQKCVTFTGKEYLSREVDNTFTTLTSLTGRKKPKNTNEMANYDKIDKAFYYCDQPEKGELDESWYYMQAYMPGFTLLMDSFGPTEIKFIKVVRGDENYDMLKKIFEDQTKQYLVVNQTNINSPDKKLLQDWGHLVKTEEDPSNANRLVIENFEHDYTHILKKPSEDPMYVYKVLTDYFESAFPGTIQSPKQRLRRYN